MNLHLFNFYSIYYQRNTSKRSNTTHSVPHYIPVREILANTLTLCVHRIGRKEGNVLFNDALNTFYLRLYGVGRILKQFGQSYHWYNIVRNVVVISVGGAPVVVCPVYMCIVVKVADLYIFNEK